MRVSRGKDRRTGNCHRPGAFISPALKAGGDGAGNSQLRQSVTRLFRKARRRSSRYQKRCMMPRIQNTRPCSRMKRWRAWAFPLTVIGMNSIAAYLIAHLFERFFESSFRIHLGSTLFAMMPKDLAWFLTNLGVLTCYWLVLFWMYRRKLFLKI